MKSINWRMLIGVGLLLLGGLTLIDTFDLVPGLDNLWSWIIAAVFALAGGAFLYALIIDRGRIFGQHQRSLLDRIPDESQTLVGHHPRRCPGHPGIDRQPAGMDGRVRWCPVLPRPFCNLRIVGCTAQRRRTDELAVGPFSSIVRSGLGDRPVS